MMAGTSSGRATRATRRRAARERVRPLAPPGATAPASGSTTRRPCPWPPPPSADRASRCARRRPLVHRVGRHDGGAAVGRLPPPTSPTDARPRRPSVRHVHDGLGHGPGIPSIPRISGAPPLRVPAPRRRRPYRSQESTIARAPRAASIDTTSGGRAGSAADHRTRANAAACRPHRARPRRPEAAAPLDVARREGAQGARDTPERSGRRRCLASRSASQRSTCRRAAEVSGLHQ